MNNPPATSDSGNQPLPRMEYDSAGAAPGEAFEAWQELFGQQVKTETVEPRRSFQASLKFWNLGGVVFHEAHLSAIRLERRPRHVATGPFDGVALELLLRGQETIRSHGSEVTAGDRRAVVTDWSRPRASLRSDSTSLLVAIPRSLIRRRDRLAAAEANLAIDLDTPAGRLVEQTMLNVRSTLPETSRAQAPCMGESLCELVNDLIDTRLAAVSLDLARQRATLPAMQAWLTQRLATRGLGVQSLMCAFHMSRASIYRLFKPCGGVNRFIREQRLQAILHELVADCPRPRGVEAVADRWGYDDTKYFYRAFKQHFGCTPTEARQAAQGEYQLMPLVGEAPHPLARRLYDWLDRAD